MAPGPITERITLSRNKLWLAKPLAVSRCDLLLAMTAIRMTVHRVKDFAVRPKCMVAKRDGRGIHLGIFAQNCSNSGP